MFFDFNTNTLVLNTLTSFCTWFGIHEDDNLVEVAKTVFFYKGFCPQITVNKDSWFLELASAKEIQSLTVPDKISDQDDNLSPFFLPQFQ